MLYQQRYKGETDESSKRASDVLNLTAEKAEPNTSYFKMETDQQKAQGITSWQEKGYNFFLMSKKKNSFHLALIRVYNK